MDWGRGMKRMVAVLLSVGASVGMAETTVQNTAQAPAQTDSQVDDSMALQTLTQSPAVRDLKWSQLVPKGYEPEVLLEKYEKDIERLNNLPDDSEEGIAIIQRITEEINNSPMNETLNGQTVKIAGYIAPLDVKNGAISRFLLVPYFGACIHVPPPPLNQTIMVIAAPKHGIKLHQVDYPFEVTGKITVKTAKTDIGTAGYFIDQAQTEVYKDDIWLEEE